MVTDPFLNALRGAVGHVIRHGLERLSVSPSSKLETSIVVTQGSAMTAPSSVDRLRQAIAETLSIDAQGLQAAIGQLVVATSADYPAAGPEAAVAWRQGGGHARTHGEILGMCAR